MSVSLNSNRFSLKDVSRIVYEASFWKVLLPLIGLVVRSRTFTVSKWECSMQAFAMLEPFSME